MPVILALLVGIFTANSFAAQFSVGAHFSQEFGPGLNFGVNQKTRFGNFGLTAMLFSKENTTSGNYSIFVPKQSIYWKKYTSPFAGSGKYKMPAMATIDYAPPFAK